MAKKLDVDLQQIEELAGRGYGIGMICDAIGINRSTAYRNSNISNAIKAGHSQARQKVVDDLMARSEADPGATAAIYLSKQLKCFDDHFSTASPKTPEDALTKISSIFVAVSRNQLSESKGNHLIGYLQSYLKAYEINDLEKRLDVVEKALDDKR